MGPEKCSLIRMNAVHLSLKVGPTIGLLAFKYYAREEVFRPVPSPVIFYPLIP